VGSAQASDLSPLVTCDRKTNFESIEKNAAPGRASIRYMSIIMITNGAFQNMMTALSLKNSYSMVFKLD